MALSKLTITPFKQQGQKQQRDTSRAFEVLFNPSTYTITKTVAWSSPKVKGQDVHVQTGVNAPTLTFSGGGIRQLTLDLFFDVTEPSLLNPRFARVTDVREVTDKIVALTQIDRSQNNHPPVCEVAWGKGNTKDFPFIGVVSNLTQRFTLFDSDGTPLRATLTVVFLEFLNPEEDKRKTDPEQTRHTIKLGDTLTSIAAEVYQDPTLWRVIADANGLDDPRRLVTGTTLTIPKL